MREWKIQHEADARERKRISSLDEEIGEHVRRLQEEGALQHLHGKPLDLDDDPDWLIHRVLKNAGMSHPLLEHRSDIEQMQAALEKPLLRLRERREFLVESGHGTAPAVLAFNAERETVLSRYRAALGDVQKRSDSFNLQAPAPLQVPRLDVEGAFADAEASVPPITEWARPVPRRLSLPRRLRRPRRESPSS